MSRLIKNGKIIYDKIHTKQQLIDYALEELEIIEGLMEFYDIKDIFELKDALRFYKENSHAKQS